MLYACARFADDFDCSVPALGAPADGFVIRRGRHPLLLAQGVPVVPFDLEMGGSERTLLVSGPNTGGKTVLLKSVALCSVLVQCGVPAPVGAGSRLAVFDDVFADVGDEQSIQASLSTFSAHVRNLGDILARATSSSLVLIDELGSGTDPLEGAALGGAVLEALTARGTLTLATTHLGALKELATEVGGVVNASLEFDAVQLAPTYRLIKGVPGRSYGLSIARRLALPEAVIARAEARVPQVERDVEALLADLQGRTATLAERERGAAESMADASERATRVEQRERAVRERERELERRSRQEARQYLLNARAQVEQTVRELQAALAGGGDASERVRRARQRVEQLAAEQGEALAGLAGEATAAPPVNRVPAAPPRAGALAVGDIVQVPSLEGRAGRLLDLQDGDAVVAIGAIKMRVPAGTLLRSAQPAPEAVVPVAADVPDVHASSEIDVRGMRAVEVEEIVMQAVDAAVRADLPELRIIHGKGTGVLREVVGEMLRKDARVRVVRLGAWNEGGAGVTVAELA
jgi:DNA mismatch repair protein MutS2